VGPGRPAVVGSPLPGSDTSADHAGSADHDGAAPATVVEHSEH